MLRPARAGEARHERCRRHLDRKIKHRERVLPARHSPSSHGLASIGPNARTGVVQYDALFAASGRRCADRGRQRHAANEGGRFHDASLRRRRKSGHGIPSRRLLSRPSRASARERVRRLCSVLRSARNCFSSTPLLSLKQCEKFGFK